MAISYPLTAPTDPHPKFLNFLSKSVVSRSQSLFTGASQVYAHSGQWWEIEVILPPLTRAQAQPWIAFLTKLNGKEGTFYYGPIREGTPLGTATGTPLVNGGSQTGSDLVTDGWTSSVTGILKAGDYISVANNLYRVLDDVDSDGFGNATIPIWPNIRTSSTSDNAPITVSNPKSLFRLVSNELSIVQTDSYFYNISFIAEEAL